MYGDFSGTTVILFFSIKQTAAFPMFYQKKRGKETQACCLKFKHVEF